MPGINHRTPRPLNPRWTAQLPEFVRTIAVSPDSRWIACGDASGTLSIFSTDSGELRTQKLLFDSPVSFLRWPRSDRLVCTGGGSVTIIDPGDDGPTRHITFDTDAFWIEDLAISADNDRFVLCTDKIARVYTFDGTSSFVTPPQASTLTGAAFLDDDRLVTSCYGSVCIWDVLRGELYREFSWKGSFFRPHPSPDASVIACGCQDSSVHFWRLPSGRDSQMMGYPGKPHLLDWSHDSHLLATAASTVLLVWSFRDSGPEGTTPVTMEGHGCPISAMNFHPQLDLVLSGDEIGMLLLWNPKQGEIPLALATLQAEISALAWHKDGQSFFAGDGNGNLARFAHG